MDDSPVDPLGPVYPVAPVVPVAPVAPVAAAPAYMPTSLRGHQTYMCPASTIEHDPSYASVMAMPH